MLTINANLVQIVIFGFIEAKSVTLLVDEIVYQLSGHAPIFLLIITSRFLQNKLNQISYKRTKDKQKTLNNAKKVYKKTFFQFVYTICYKNINKYFIVNINTTGKILFSGGNNSTYKIKKVKQVLIYRKVGKKSL